MVREPLPSGKGKAAGKRSLDMRVGSSIGLVAALALAGACSNPESKTLLRPEGNPEIRQLFVIDSDGVSKLAYGTHPDIVDEDPSDGITPPYSNQIGPVDNALVQANRVRIVI